MAIRFRFLLTTTLVAATLAPAYASSPKFFQAATQTEFLKGDVENLSIDVHGQLTLGPVTELVYETSAPFLWSMIAAPDGTLFVGTGNEGKVYRDRSAGQRIALLRQRRARSARARAWRPTAAFTSGPPRRQDLQGRSQRHGDHLLQRRRQIHLGARRRRATATCYAGTGDKGVIHKITPDGKGTVFYKTNTTHVDRAGLRQERQSARRHRNAGQGAAHRSGRQAFHAARFAVPGNPRASLRRQGHALRRGDQRTTSSGAAPVDRGHRPRPRVTGDSPRAPIASVSAEITSMSIVDTSGSTSGAPRARIAVRSKAPSIASRPTACGISSGNRATTRRTT